MEGKEQFVVGMFKLRNFALEVKMSQTNYSTLKKTKPKQNKNSV